MTGLEFDLPAYLARIGYAGPVEPSLPALHGVVAGHSASIAFENIDVLAGRPIRLDLESVQQKLVQARRGGYCFEQNALLLGGLRAIGFRAAGLLARVRLGVPPEVATPRSHMLLRVDLPEGPHIADAGFGGLTPTAALALRPGAEQATPHEPFRILGAGEEFLLQAKRQGEWGDIYQFSLQEQLPVDYEVANWFTSTRPHALFTENLVVTQPGPGRRRTVFNGYFTTQSLDGRRDRRVLRGAEEYRRVLADEFGLALTEADLAAIMALMDRRNQDAQPGDMFA